MKRTLAFTMATLSLFGAQLVQAEDRTYVQIDALQFVNVDEFDDEQSFGATIGYNISDRNSFELEFQVNGFDSTDPGFQVDADVVTYLVNYRRTFWSEANRSISGRLGAGFSEPEFGTSATDRGTDSIFVWHVGLSAEYSWESGLYAAGSVRLQSFGEIEDADVSYDIGTPIVLGLSLGYRF